MAASTSTNGTSCNPRKQTVCSRTNRLCFLVAWISGSTDGSPLLLPPTPDSMQLAVLLYCILLPPPGDYPIAVNKYIIYKNVGSDSSVGIATRYGLGGSGIESRWGEIFRTCPDRPWGPIRLLYNGYRVSYPRVKRSGHGFDHPHPSRTQVKERAELYLYSPLGLRGLV